MTGLRDEVGENYFTRLPKYVVRKREEVSLGGSSKAIFLEVDKSNKHISLPGSILSEIE
jgi:hypothetical protein